MVYHLTRHMTGHFISEGKLSNQASPGKCTVKLCMCGVLVG